MNRKEPDYKTIGETIHDLRIQNNQTQRDLAEELGISLQSVSKWENGERISFENLYAISNYFDVSIDYLMGRSKYKTMDQDAIGELTGLSQKSVNNLVFCSGSGESLYGKGVFVRYTDLFSSMELIDCLLSSDLLAELALCFTRACRHQIDQKLAPNCAELAGTRQYGFYPQFAIDKDRIDSLSKETYEEEILWLKEEAESKYKTEIYNIQMLTGKILDEAVQKTITPEVIKSLLEAIN